MYNTLQKKHKTLTTEVIKYFQKWFSNAMKQNKGQEDTLKSTLSAIVPHSFGHHDKCGNWCKAGNENYSHRSLPGGNPLSGDELYNDLRVIFETMSNNAHTLAPCGSTKVFFFLYSGLFDWLHLMVFHCCILLYCYIFCFMSSCENFREIM